MHVHVHDGCPSSDRMASSYHQPCILLGCHDGDGHNHDDQIGHHTFGFGSTDEDLENDDHDDACHHMICIASPGDDDDVYPYSYPWYRRLIVCPPSWSNPASS